MRKFKSFTCLAIAGLIGGCSGGPGGGGEFENVRSLSRDRLGMDIRWEQDSADGEAIAARVRQLIGRPLTAASAVQLALLNNRQLQATFEDVGIAQADLVQAGLLRNPVFDMSVRFPDRPPGHTYLDFSAAENLLDVFLIPGRKKIAQAELAEAQAHVADEVFDLAAQTASAFYSCQAAQEVAAIRQQQSDAADAAMESADRLYQAGNVAELTYLREKASADRAKLDRADALSDVEDARTQLELLMGIAGMGMRWTIIAKLPTPSPGHWSQSDLQRRALRQRQDLQAARQEVLVEARRLGLTSESRFFDESDSVALGPEGERETDGQWRIGPTINFPIPLFDQGQARIAKTEAILRQAQQRYAELAVEVCAQVRIAYDHLKLAGGQAALYQSEILPTQKELVEATLRHYNGMFASVFDLLGAKRDQLAADEQYVAALQAYWTAHANLERAVGGRFDLPATPTVLPTTQSNGERP